MTSTRLRAMLLLTAMAGIGLVARSGWLLRGPVICPMRSFTGVPCGGCGMTRGMSAMSRGEVSQAIDFHIATVPLTALILLAAVIIVMELLSGQTLLARAWHKTGRWIIWSLVIATAIGWSINLARHFG